ncbi:restriction endonuclease [Patescibacteria group bacterium]|nr:restriction endonuclease [Patescibacteria group bacterium]
MDIIKASGEKEKFNKVKLYQSLKRAGVQPKLAGKVCKTVAKSIRHGMNSGEILDQTTKCLQEENPILAARYNLKRAIMELGPAGFLFEKYIAEILKEYGYTTKVGSIVKGYCISHEIDVVVRKGKKHFMIECKYHNNRGIRSDVKVALYVYARFLDVKKAWEKKPGHQYFFHQAWLVTNTKCTSEAIRYARCAGLKIISWRYPKDKSLECLIEKKGLYPITILPSLTKYAKEMLAKKRIVLAKDLLKYSLHDLVRLTGLQSNITRKLQEETKQLCLR